MHPHHLCESVESEAGGTACSRNPFRLLRSPATPLRLGEIAQAVVILAFAFAMPFLVIPTIAVLLIVLLDRLGLTLFGKIVVLVVVAAMIWLTLAVFGYAAGSFW